MIAGSLGNLTLVRLDLFAPSLFIYLSPIQSPSSATHPGTPLPTCPAEFQKSSDKNHRSLFLLPSPPHYPSHLPLLFTMTQFFDLAPAASPVEGASDPSPPSSPTPTPQDELRSALAHLSITVDAVKGASAAVGDTPVSQVFDAVADLAAAATAVCDAAAEVTTAAESFLAESAPSSPAPARPLPAMFRTTGPWIAGNLFVVVPPVHLTAVPDNNNRWFAITSGKYIGLTKNHALSLNAVVGVSNALSTGFSSQAEALDHFNDALDGDTVFLIR
ncbi:hypothetical protein DFH06DRAFT_1337078 [Mycena polygramma]|nr:hypothetical protein DFH06DRAFT_1337078 [Mycena polygramma]